MMTMRKKIGNVIILGFFATLLIGFPSKQLANNGFKEKTDTSGEVVNGLQLIINSDKEIYGVDNPIIIQFSIFNVSQEKITVPWIKFHMLFHVRGLKEFKFDTDHVKNLDYSKSDLIELSPGEHKERTFIIPQTHDNTHFNKIPGEYKIFATFEPWEDGEKYGIKAWTGTLISNTITIKVVKKEGYP